MASSPRPPATRPASGRKPVVVLPPSRPGGAERRFVVHPRRVLLLLAGTFAAGLAVGLIALGLALRDRDGWIDRYDALMRQNELLQAQLARLAGDALGAPGEPDDPDAEAAAPQPPPELRIPVFDGPPAVRLALLSSEGSVRLQGDELVIDKGPRKSVPMPRPSWRAPEAILVARASDHGVFVEGYGEVPDGTRILNRVGDIVIDGATYPSTIELQRDKGRLVVVHEIPLERYLQGVVRWELPRHWGLETKKAQAVAARTYALIRKAATSGPFDLETTVDDQVYKAEDIDPTTRAAVAATSGEVLTHNGYLVTTYFHSTCGGRTELPRDVWGDDPDQPSFGLKSVDCPYSSAAPNWSWTVELSPQDLLSALHKAGEELGAVQGLRIRSRSEAGGVTVLEVLTDGEPISLSGNEFRRIVGWGRVKSTHFDIEAVGERAFRLTGHGAGHGVGMSQWGLRGMEQEGGYGYRDMLQHFYPLGRVDRIY